MELARDGRCNWGEALKRSQSAATYQSAHEFMTALAKDAKRWYLSGNGPLVFSVAPATRSLEQNRRLWAMLRDLSRQVDWYGRKLSDEEWKSVMTAAMKKQDVVPGVDGGFVVLGQSTSKMTKGEMSELQELIEAFGAQQNVKFSAPDWMED